MISKTNLGEFDNISIFNEEYILVERKGLFNLIDKDGNYVSKIWYKGIRKDSGCGADFIEPRTQRKVQMRSIPLIGTYSHLRGALNNTAILDRIDTRCIAVISPCSMFSVTTNKVVTIIAKVTILGKELLLGKNGKLYEKYYDEVKEYTLPSFFISLTDINRLIDIADKFNCIYNSTYDANHKKETVNADDITETKTSCWIFGFDASGGMEFNSSCKTPIQRCTIKAWGGDTIKVRFDCDNIPTLYREKFTNFLIEKKFTKWESKKSVHNWYTKKYVLGDLDKLFEDMTLLGQKLNFIN